jgi:hypothetical protein
MSALTLRKKRNLGNCLTNSTLNPRTHKFNLEGGSKGLESPWNVEEFAQEQMENGHQITKIEIDELIQQLQVFDQSASREEITRLLRQNQGDSISVMNILKEKSQRKQKLKMRARKRTFRGKELGQQILERIKQKKSREKVMSMNMNKPITTLEESPSISTEKRVKSPIQDSEKLVNFQFILNKFLQCKNQEDLAVVVQEVSQSMNEDKKKMKKLKSENYILKMGIRQRKEIFHEEVRNRIILEEKLKETEIKLQAVESMANNYQFSNNCIWKSDFRRGEGF